MKKKRIEALPPIQLRETRKKPYLAVADIEDICGQLHLIIDVYEGVKHIRRVAYTENDWGVWEPGGQWNAKRIGEGAPEWDVYDMISGPGLPDKAKWSNTGIDDQSKEVIKKFVMGAAKAAGRYVSPILNDCWSYLVRLEDTILDARREKREQNCLDRLYERCEDMPKLPQDLEKWADRVLYFKDICPENWIELKRPYVAVFKLIPEDPKYSAKARFIGKVFSEGEYTGMYTLAKDIKEMMCDIEQACFRLVHEAPGPGDAHDLICVYV